VFDSAAALAFKVSDVAFSDANLAADSVNNDFASLNQTADGALAEMPTFGELLNREKSRVVLRNGFHRDLTSLSSFPFHSSKTAWAVWRASIRVRLTSA